MLVIGHVFQAIEHGHLQCYLVPSRINDIDSLFRNHKKEIRDEAAEKKIVDGSVSPCPDEYRSPPRIGTISSRVSGRGPGPRVSWKSGNQDTV